MTTKSQTGRQTGRLRALDSVANARIIFCSVAERAPSAPSAICSAPSGTPAMPTLTKKTNKKNSYPVRCAVPCTQTIRHATVDHKHTKPMQDDLHLLTRL